MDEKMGLDGFEPNAMQEVSPEEEMDTLEYQQQVQQMERCLRRSWNMAEKLAADGLLEMAQTFEQQYFEQYALYCQRCDEHLYTGLEERCVSDVPHAVYVDTHKRNRKTQPNKGR